jgi:hypothetical protein
MCASTVAPRALGTQQSPNSRELRRGMHRWRWAPQGAKARRGTARGAGRYASHSRFSQRDRACARRPQVTRRAAGGLRRTRTPF